MKTSSSDKAIAFYRHLSLHQKINLKECLLLLCGIKWEGMTALGFTLRDKLQIIHEKLKREGFKV